MAKERWKAKNSKNLCAGYYINGRKTPIEYSTTSDMYWLGIMAEDNKELTFEQLLNDIHKGRYLVSEEVINVLKAYIHFGYGDKSMYKAGMRY